MNAISWVALITIACPLALHAETLQGRPSKTLTPDSIQQYEHEWVRCRGQVGFVVNGWLYRVDSDPSKFRRVHPKTARTVLQFTCPKYLCKYVAEPTCVMEQPDAYWRK